MRVTRTAICAVMLMVLTNCVRAAERNDANLWRPRLPTPALVALDSDNDRQFTAEVRASSAAHDWHATIANDLASWNCELVSARYAKIKQESEDGWQLTFRVPANASPELFDLTISSSEGTSTQNQSVSISPAFATDFYILHITDEQIVNEKHTDPSGQYYHMVGTAEELHWMQEPVNLIHPRFVFVTGDQIDYNGALDGWNNWTNWGYKPAGAKHFTKQETLEIETRLGRMYFECHRGYRVPYVESPGNHDVTPGNKKLVGSKIVWHDISASFYEKYFGQRSWSLRMGDFYVLMHDWSDQAMEKWSEADYAASQADPTIKFRLIGEHYVHDKGFDSHAFVPPMCDLMLIGHGHTTATKQTSPYYIYEDGPAFKYGMTGFFNFRRSGSSWTCDQTAGPRDVAKDVWPLFTDNGVTKKVRCDQGDPMNVTSHSITITNDLPEEFYDGRVRFVLDRGQYSSVTNGTILSQYPCHEGAKTAVLVKVDIPAKNSITVTMGNSK